MRSRSRVVSVCSGVWLLPAGCYKPRADPGDVGLEWLLMDEVGDCLPDHVHAYRRISMRSDSALDSVRWRRVPAAILTAPVSARAYTSWRALPGSVNLTMPQRLHWILLPDRLRRDVVQQPHSPLPRPGRAALLPLPTRNSIFNRNRHLPTISKSLTNSGAYATNWIAEKAVVP